MAAMIWDTEAQAFKKANVPIKYESTAGAWTDTTGLVWDNEAQAWTEKWKPGDPYIIKKGIITNDYLIIKNQLGDNMGCISDSRVVIDGNYNSSSGSFDVNLGGDAGGMRGGVIIHGVNFTGYEKMCVDFYYSESGSYIGASGCFHVYAGTPSTYSDQSRIITAEIKDPSNVATHIISNNTRQTISCSLKNAPLFSGTNKIDSNNTKIDITGIKSICFSIGEWLASSSVKIYNAWLE